MDGKYAVHLHSSLVIEYGPLTLLKISCYMIHFMYLMDMYTFKDMVIQGRLIISPKHSSQELNLIVMKLLYIYTTQVAFCCHCKTMFQKWAVYYLEKKNVRGVIYSCMKNQIAIQVFTEEREVQAL